MQVTIEPKLNNIAPPSINDGGQASLRLVNPAPKQPTLESQIDLILGNTEYLLPILKAVRQIFNDLVRLLDCLRLMEQAFTKSRKRSPSSTYSGGYALASRLH